MLNSEAATGQAAAPVGRIASFGKYLLLQRVSVGGMAEVFKAIPEGAARIDQIVAIKRILPNIAEDREFIGMFIDEARIAGQLTHPNICRIYELGRVGADHYIAMQFLWGRDLLKVMNRFKRAGLLIPPPMAVFIAAHAAGALHYAHNKRDTSGAPLHIIHRDVSPQNIIVGYSGQAKLIDFGVARAASQSQKTQAGILKGKFGYMSPEMIRGLPVDHRSDVFAMGICLYEALTGSRLFYGETDFATLELVRDAKILPPSSKAPGIPAELDAIVLKALSRDADQRYQSANELAEALETFLDRFHPGFGEAEVSASMREAFANELAREKLRLDAFAEMLDSGALVRGATLPALPNDPPPSGERSAAPNEAVPGSRQAATPAASTSESPPAPQDERELPEEQTQIFFSAAELSELRQLDAPPDSAWRPPAPSDVIMRQSSGLTAPPPMPAPSFTTLTPSGTYPRRTEEGSREAPIAALVGGRHSDDGRVQTQPMRTYEGAAQDAASFDRADRHRGTVRASLLAVAALLLAALGYSAVSTGTRHTANLEVGAAGAQDALVRVDGVVRGNAPLNVEGLLPGVHRVEVEASGFEVARVEVSMEAGTTREVNLTLKRRGAPSVDTLAQTKVTESDASPASAGEAPLPGKASPAAPKPFARPALLRPRAAEAVPLTGGAAQGSGAGIPQAVAAEQPSAMVTNAGDEQADTPPPTGETQLGETINEEAAAAGEGELLISTVPWSRVIIDGTDTGRDTPVRALRVAEGNHTIVLRTPEGDEHSVQVSVVAGKTVRIIRRF